MPDDPARGGAVARNLGPAPLRALLVVLALAYFSILIADHVRARGLRSVVPGPVLFFAQIADLFPDASSGIIEYRAEGWLCAQKRFVELDMGKLFPMLAGNKENRFYRLMHFYRQTPAVLHALDEYCVSHYPMAESEAGPDRIAGVRFMSLILPLPGDPSQVVRYARKPLEAFPDVPHHLWYRTSTRALLERCSSRAGPGTDSAAPAPGAAPALDGASGSNPAPGSDGKAGDR